MSDALSKFISGLQTLDANNLGAPQNAAALKKFQSLDGNSQKAVMNDLTSAYGTSFDELNGLSDADKARVMDNMKNGRGTFDGVTRPQAEKPKTFNEQWLAASQSNNATASNDAYATSHADFAKHHGQEAARRRHGYIPPERQAQLERIASMQTEARRLGKSFGDVADQFVRAGK
jgi:hypothetical protein